jgi:hypothetical protein
MISCVKSQNQAGFGLSVAPQNHYDGLVRFLLAAGFFLSLLDFGLCCYVKALA